MGGSRVLVCPLRSMCRVPKLELGPIAPLEASGGGQLSQHPKPSPCPEANRDDGENIQIQHTGEMQRRHKMDGNLNNTMKSEALCDLFLGHFPFCHFAILPL